MRISDWSSDVCSSDLPWGGVLAIAGDDHVAKSSTVPHQSEFAFLDASMPVLNPAGVQDTLDFGLLGIAMSRFAGVWVRFQTTAEIRSAARRVGKECVRTGKSRGPQLHNKKNHNHHPL